MTNIINFNNPSNLNAFNKKNNNYNNDVINLEFDKILLKNNNGKGINSNQLFSKENSETETVDLLVNEINK